MTITVNGEQRSLEKSINLLELLQTLDLPAARVAVELNQNVVRRAAWGETFVRDNDKIEIVHFVGGG